MNDFKSRLIKFRVLLLKITEESSLLFNVTFVYFKFIFDRLIVFQLKTTNMFESTSHNDTFITVDNV